MINAIIFDMDGLIVNSEPIQSKSFEIVMKKYGAMPVHTENRLIQKIGLSSRENWNILKKKYKIEDTIERLVAKRKKVYLELLRRNVNAMPGVVNLLRAFYKNRYKLAVASNSSREQINIVLSKLRIGKYFSAIISAKHVRKSKPFPDIFLHAAKKLNAHPSECIVFEDSNPGVIAAKKAGMKVIAVPSKYTKNHNFSKADLVVNSLNDIKWDTISKL